MMIEREFLDLYNSPLKYRPNKKTYGVELELVLFDGAGNVVPRAYEIVLELWKHEPNKAHFKWEFFAGQIEINTGVHSSIDCLLDELFNLVLLAQQAAFNRGWHFVDVAYLDTPGQEFGLKDLTPVSLEPRYHDYAKKNPHKIDAMCRVAAVHVQVGNSNLPQVIAMHDAMVRIARKWSNNQYWVCQKRLQVFTNLIYPDFLDIPEYGDVEGMLAHARQIGFERYLSEYFAAVRINAKYTTAEFRLCDTTLDFSLAH